MHSEMLNTITSYGEDPKVTLAWDSVQRKFESKVSTLQFRYLAGQLSLLAFPEKPPAAKFPEGLIFHFFFIFFSISTQRMWVS